MSEDHDPIQAIEARLAKLEKLLLGNNGNLGIAQRMDILWRIQDKVLLLFAGALGSGLTYLATSIFK